jgi:NAD(P)-dependent dehydrogenase (short-subunit alcohol dehydrogenase family)
MDFSKQVALVTGASRGLGRHFVQQLLARGVKVYATARNPSQITIPGAQALYLDVTDPASVIEAAQIASDVTLLVNNAGVITRSNLVTSDLDDVRLELETNFFGTLNVVRAFAPVLAKQGGGAILNVLSRLSWVSYPGANGYAASKAAAWSLTNSIRLELAEQGTQVSGLLLSSTDTDMMAGFDIPKNNPVDVVNLALDGVAAGELEIIADSDTAQVKAALSADPRLLYPQFA